MRSAVAGEIYQIGEAAARSGVTPDTEGIKLAAQAFTMDVAKLSCCGG